MRRMIAWFLLLAVIVCCWPFMSVDASQFLSYPLFQALTDSGAPGTGYKLYFYYPGTSTPKTAYSDSSLTTPISNPYSLNSRGESAFPIYLNGSYKLILKDSSDVTVWTVDNFRGQSSTPLTYLCLSDYTDLDTAISSIGGSNRTLYLDTSDTLSGDVTVPINISLVGVKGNKIATNGHTLTINGPFQAGLYQVFDTSGGGSVTFGNGAVSAVRPEWWGAIIDDLSAASANTTAINNAVNTGLHVQFSNGTYYHDDELVLWSASGQILSGAGIDATILRLTGTSKSAFASSNSTYIGWCKLENMTLDGQSSTTSTGIRLHSDYAYKDIFLNLKITSFERLVYSDKSWGNIFEHVLFYGGTESQVEITDADTSNEFRQCQFDEIASGKYGYAGGTTSNVPAIVNFKECKFSGSGSGVYASGGSYHFESCNFDGLGATAVGIVLGMYWQNVTVEESRFYANPGPDTAVRIDHVGVSDVSNLIFRNNLTSGLTHVVDANGTGNSNASIYIQGDGYVDNNTSYIPVHYLSRDGTGQYLQISQSTSTLTDRPTIRSVYTHTFSTPEYTAYEIDVDGHDDTGTQRNVGNITFKKYPSYSGGEGAFGKIGFSVGLMDTGAWKEWGHSITFYDKAPTMATWSQADIVYNHAPTAGGTLGWVCVRGGVAAPAWAASTSYSVGDQVVPTTDNGYYYECTVAGTSGGSEPSWPTTVGNTVTDGTVTWECKGTSALFKTFGNIAS